MSRLIKAITDMMQSSQGNARKGRKSETFSRSEFKKLIQQEFVPVKVTAGAGGGKGAGKGTWNWVSHWIWGSPIEFWGSALLDLGVSP
uniref:Uncharacterized protein n=1 Tax=Serinus canaria TaxID=9135 RepID=A0A8C9NC12_SERCA